MILSNWFSLDSRKAEKRLGPCGEELAAKHLRGAGFKIRELNWRSSYGEIDIVAEEKGTLVFVEVKTRRSLEKGDPLEAIDSRKQRKLIQLAEHYVAENRLEGRALRIDCVGILFEKDNPEPRIEHLRGAVEASY